MPFRPIVGSWTNAYLTALDVNGVLWSTGHDGSIIHAIKLRSGPDYILLQGDRLFVRTYDTDYIFRVPRSN